MQIREATRADVRQIVSLFHDTIHTVNTRDYTDEQVNAWSPFVPDADVWAERKIQTRITFVADENGTITGFGELENNGHIDCFYCHQKYQRRGIGSAIFRQIEEKAKILGLSRLFLESSITARPFFEAHGFTVVKQQIVIRKGIELTNFVMEKLLTANKASEAIGAQGAPQPQH